MKPALPAAFDTAIDSEEHDLYRKGYRSFRRAASEQAQSGRASAPQRCGRVPVPSVASAMRRFEGQQPPPRKVPSSLSVDSLSHRLDEDRRRLGLRGGGAESDEEVEVHLAASPFRLRPGARRVQLWCEMDAQAASRSEYAPDLMQLGDGSLSEDLVKLGRSGARFLRGMLGPEAQPDADGADGVAPTRISEDAAAETAAARAAAASQRTTALFVLVWYFTGAFTNSSSKLALSSLPRSLPLTLTAVQHAAASLCGGLVYRLLRLQPYKPLPSAAELSPAARSALGWLCAVYSLGFALTNGSFGAVNASFVDTVKAAEPISTVALAVLFLANERITPRVVLALLPIVCGVGLSSMAEASASAVGLALALGSNCCFSARSIAAKLVGKHTRAGQMDGANLFVHVNRIGLYLLLPAALALEGRRLAWLAGALPAERLLASARLFAFNGLMYYLNNQMNFLVLEQVDTLTHGIINCGRRVANIAFAILWFGNRVTPFNGAGICMAVAGGFLYVRAKLQDAREEAKRKAAGTAHGGRERAPEAAGKPAGKAD